MKRSLVRRFARSRRGTTAVEFAIASTPFFLLLFGIIEFSRMLWTLNAIQQAAIEGARCMGIVNTNCGSGGTYSSGATTTFIENTASGWGVTLTAGDITLNNAATCAGVAGFSEVTINYTFQTVVPLITQLSSDALSANACFPNGG